MTDRMAKRRVKLYALNAERQWDDRGTGHVTSSFVDRLKGMSLLVRAESDGTLLLESKIMPDTAYQKQQGTLIVWSEAENFDLALSFQEKIGCDEIWEKICQVQGKDPSVEITQDLVEESEDERYEDASDTDSWVELPPCELAKLEDINDTISNGLVAPVRREKLALALENESYIKKLISLFHTCEDLENIEGLHVLYEIFKNIFLLNKNPLFEIMFADDMIFDVVGVLEYDPSSTYPKRHRHYLKSIAKFKEVIPIENHELLSKIHQTYRVQYIQDVVLPTPAVFEENMLSTLSSFIYFNKVEIVSLIQEDTTFLSELFHQLGSPEDEIILDKRRDLVLFLKEFCTFSQTLQLPNKEQFFKALSTLGVLSALEITLTLEDQMIKAASIDILNYIVEFSPSMVREYMMQQLNKVEEEQYLLNIILEQMVLDSDPEMGGAVQLMGMLRILIDPDNMMASVSKSERADFLSFFYKHSMHALVAPLLSNTAGDEIGREDYQTAHLLALILELLSFCVEHHTYHIKNYIVQRDLLKRILVLMKSKHTFLVLSALRFMRKIISLKDDIYNIHIVNSNLFAPVVDAFVRNNGRYNLLDSAIIELFEYIRVDDVQSLCINIVEKFGPELSKIDYVQTFRSLRERYDQYQEKIKDREKGSLPMDSLKGVVRGSALSGMGVGLGVGPMTTRFRRDVRDMEAEEEMWFNNDEDDYEEKEVKEAEANNSLVHSVFNNRDHQQQSTLTTPPVGTAIDKFEREVCIGNPLSPKVSLFNNSKDTKEVNIESNDSERSKSALLNFKKVSLVDYDENSDEEEEVENLEEGQLDGVGIVDRTLSPPIPKKPKVNVD